MSGSYDGTHGYTLNNDRERWRVGFKLNYDRSKTSGVLVTTDVVNDRRGSPGYPDFPTPLARRDGVLSNTAVRARLGPFTSTTTFVSSGNRNTDAAISLDRRIHVSELGETVTGARASPRWGATSYGANVMINRADGSGFAARQEQTWSVFAVQALPRTWAPVALTLGVRATVNSAFGDALNPEVKASFGPRHRLASIGYSRSNNTPSFQQRYNETSTTKPNPALDMETAHNLSAGFATSWSDRASAEIGGYYNRLRNRITFVVGDDGTARYLNLGAVVYAGVDASMTWKPLPPLTLKTTYSHLDAHDEATSLRLPGKSRHSGNVSFQYRAGDGLSVNVLTEYLSRAYRDTRNTVALRPRLLTSLRMELTRRHTTLFAEASNLFDRAYLYSDGLLAPPRLWFVGMNYKL